MSGQPAFGLSGSAYNSLSLVNGYSGQVQSAGSQTFHAVTLAAPGAFNPQGDVTVDQSVNWTQGSLGGNGTNFRMTGGTAAITAGAGNTVQSGMGLIFGGTVVGTISTGTLRFLNTKGITVTDTSKVSATNLTITSAVAGGDPVTLPAGKAQTFTAKTVDSARGLLVQGGKAVAEGGGAVKFSGVFNTAFFASVRMEGGALVVENGTTLDAGTTFDVVNQRDTQNNVSVAGGRLATRAKAGVQAQPDATIKASTLYVAGGTTEVKIGDVAENPAGVVGHQYGRLVATNDIAWNGGTYRPACKPGDVNTADLWLAKGEFTVGASDATGGPRVAPEAGGAGNFAANSDYLVIESLVAIKGNGGLPQSTAAGWNWAPGTDHSNPNANPPVIVKQWKVRKA